MYRGVAASPGISVGKVYLFKEQEVIINTNKINEAQVTSEIEAFHQALHKSRQQLEELKNRVVAKMGREKGEIFEAHITILADPLLCEQVEGKVRNEQISADYALTQAITEMAALFDGVEDEYLKERVLDIKDVGLRIIRNVLGIPDRSLAGLKEEVILVAKDLTPSDTAQIDKNRVLAFVTDLGGRTSHTAIMARSLEIPAVVGLTNITAITQDEDTIIVDGIDGIVEINPDVRTLGHYLKKREHYSAEINELRKIKSLPGETMDGYRVELSANIGTPQDVKGALENGAEGIGLYRTEFLYMDRDTMPTEDEQFVAYKEVTQKMDNKPVIIRTLDIGGDKKLPYLPLPEEMNPFLGVRAIRLCLKHQDMFKTQLRAILRASTYGKLRIMYPMVARVEEVRQANKILENVKKQLLTEGIPFDNQIEVGIMVEIPSTAINADIFAKEVDFFSIGTNDLIQYTMAADRMNENLSELYEPYNPAVLRLIKNVIDASHRCGKWTGMCGEMAGETSAALVLLGMGLNEFSMSAMSIPRIKKVIRSIDMEKARMIAAKVLEMESAEQIQQYLDEELDRLFN